MARTFTNRHTVTILVHSGTLTEHCKISPMVHEFTGVGGQLPPSTPAEAHVWNGPQMEIGGLYFPEEHKEA